MDSWVWLVISFILGLALGYSFSALRQRKRVVGTLREDHSDPNEAPFLFLELEPDGMRKIHKEKKATFNVRLEDYIPRN